MLCIKGTHVMKTRKEIPLLNYDTTYSLLHRIVNFLEFIMITFFPVIDPFLRLVEFIKPTQYKILL